MHQIATSTGHEAGPESIEVFNISNAAGTEIQILNYGAIISSIRTPDKFGNTAEIALGFDNPSDYSGDFYTQNCPYFGAIAGRYANRIRSGKFTLDGATYQLAANNNGNALHGGIKGFDKLFWKGKKNVSIDSQSVELTVESPHLDEGYPGNLKVTVRYSLNQHNELRIQFNAVTDRATILNLTNHTYFNLNGDASPVTDHHLWINSRQMIEAENLIPTGRLIPVAGTVFDFSKLRTIGSNIEQLAHGYDNSYALENTSRVPEKAATLISYRTGRRVEVITNQPSLQLYSGYYIPAVTGHNNMVYGKFSGVALETQHFPDSPNHPQFPSTVLRPGEVFESETNYRFSITGTT